MDDDERWQELALQITGPLARRHSSATVLFHHAVAERLGLGPSDHKCLELLMDRGAMTGSQLAVITGLTTGAITGVLARLERSGYVQREPDPFDKRKQIVTTVAARLRDMQDVFAASRPPRESLLEGFDTAQLEGIATYLERVAEANLHRATVSRAQVLADGGPVRTTRVGERS